MRKSCLFKVLVTPMVLFLTTIANADDTVNCEEALNYCCDQKELFFVAEATFFRFHDSAGVEDGDGDNAELGYDASSRLTLGYTDCNGRGARVRWWDYDHSTRSVDNDVVSVDTYNIDLEVFQTINLPCRTTLDLGVGIRYNEFQHDFEQSWFKINQEHSFSGVGGMFAIAGSFDINCNWTAYTMFREVIMMDDGVFNGNVENDTTRPITELGFGVRFHRCNWDVHAGFEWQNWGNYTSAGIANLDQETHDVGFGGFVLGAGVTY